MYINPDRANCQVLNICSSQCTYKTEKKIVLEHLTVKINLFKRSKSRNSVQRCDDKIMFMREIHRSPENPS